MRRKDREVTDIRDIHAIIDASDCCRVAFSEADGPYIVPLNFGFVPGGEQGGVFYFHGAKEGKKAELMAGGARVGFELDTRHELIQGNTACDYAYRFQSVVGKGLASAVDDPAEKRNALICIMRHYSSRNDFAFTDAQVAAVGVFKLIVTEMTGKEHP